MTKQTIKQGGNMERVLVTKAEGDYTFCSHYDDEYYVLLVPEGGDALQVFMEETGFDPWRAFEYAKESKMRARLASLKSQVEEKEKELDALKSGPGFSWTD